MKKWQWGALSLLVVAALASPQVAFSQPTRWYVNGNGYVGTLTYRVDPRTQRVTLAGDREGRKGYRVDNFLLFEVRSSRGVQRFYIGGTDHKSGITFRGKRVQQVGNNKLSFQAGKLDLTRFFPVGEALTLRAWALDYGGVGGVSDVFLIMR